MTPAGVVPFFGQENLSVFASLMRQGFAESVQPKLDTALPIVQIVFTYVPSSGRFTVG